MKAIIEDISWSINHLALTAQEIGLTARQEREIIRRLELLMELVAKLSEKRPSNIQRFIGKVRALRFNARRARARAIQRHIVAETEQSAHSAHNCAQFAKYKKHLRKLQSMQRGAPQRCETRYWELYQECAL